MSKLHNFVISLPWETKRQEFISQQFNEQQIPFQFVEPLPLPPNPEFEAVVKRIAPYYLKDKYRRCSNPEISCAISHYLIWEKCVTENYDFVGVFEDDVVLSSQAYRFLQDDQWIKDRLQSNGGQIAEECVIRIETDLKKNFFRELPIEPIAPFRFVEPTMYCFAAGGYILSRQACIKLLSLLKDNHKQDPVDALLYCRDSLHAKSDFIQVVQLTPSIVIQTVHLYHRKNPFASSLAQNRSSQEYFVGPPRRNEVLYKLKAIFPRLAHSLIKKYLRRSSKSIFNLDKYYTPWLK